MTPKAVMMRGWAGAAVGAAALLALLVPVANAQEAGAPGQDLDRLGARLLLAASHDDVVGVRQALADGARVEDRDMTFGLTALHWAALRGDRALAEMLVTSGAPLEARTKDGDTPLLLAVARGHGEVAALLLDHGASPDRGGPHGDTPLHAAVRFNRYDLAQLLIMRGADVNRADKTGATPLHWAAAWGRAEIAALLVGKGASIGAQAMNGQTPVDIAQASADPAYRARPQLRATMVSLLSGQPPLPIQPVARLQPVVATPPMIQVTPAPVVAAPPPPPRFPETPLAVTFADGPARPDDVAVIIGNADYSRLSHDIPDDTPAYADAAGMRNYAIHALSIAPSNVIFIKDATAAQIAKVFGSKDEPRGQLSDWVKPGKSRVFVYYAGHGAPSAGDGGPYLVPVDADVGRIGLTGYPLATLYANLGKLPAESVTLVLESCFTGTSPSGPVVAKASPVFIAVKDPPVPPNLTVIAAAGADQMANWETDKSDGLFTKYFLLGMSGAADKPPSGNGDGHVSYDELDAYLKSTLTYYARRYYGRDQVAKIIRGAE